MSESVTVPKNERAPLVPKGLTKAEMLEQGWRYVTIPETDIYEYPFDGVWINNDHFKPGKHLVPSNVADSLEERLDAFMKYSIRLLRPGRDKRVARQLGGQRLTQGVAEDAEPQE